MKLLVDSNAWLWQLREPHRLNAHAFGLLEDAGNDLLLSAVSVWEVAIKQRKGTIQLPRPVSEIVAAELASGRYAALPITHDHAVRTVSLPLHHRDPFDRLLIAQAQIEGVPIVTSDAKFERYEVQVIRADR
jgi:PIN domain nuclease of toxin-antitoxin system